MIKLKMIKLNNDNDKNKKMIKIKNNTMKMMILKNNKN